MCLPQTWAGSGSSNAVMEASEEAKTEATSHHHHYSPLYFYAVGCNFCGFPSVSVVNNAANAGDIGLIPSPGRSHMSQSN